MNDETTTSAQDGTPRPSPARAAQAERFAAAVDAVRARKAEEYARAVAAQRARPAPPRRWWHRGGSLDPSGASSSRSSLDSPGDIRRTRSSGRDSGHSWGLGGRQRRAFRVPQLART